MSSASEINGKPESCPVDLATLMRAVSVGVKGEERLARENG